MNKKTGPLLEIDLASPRPVYEQIVAEMRTLLVSGDFLPGDVLPPGRQLARDLRVHHNTVAEAYRILADEGWLDLKRRTGARVLNRHTPAASSKTRRDFDRRLDGLIAEALAKGISEAAVRRRMAAVAKRLFESASNAGSKETATLTAGRS